MRKPASFAIILAIALGIVAASTVTAHEGSGEEEVVVEPGEVTAGDSVTAAGSGLEPDDERILALAGGDLVVDLGSVTTDAEGMFQTELTIPSHLPTGIYELRAIGDEIVTAELGVTAAAGGADAPSAADDASEVVVARDRAPIELALILVLVALAAVAGGLLVWRAEGVGGSAGA